MGTVPAKLAKSTRAHLERVRMLAEYGLSADQANSADARAWLRSVLQAVGDISQECKKAEPELSEFADSSRILSVSEIAEAAKVSRETIYKRRNRK